MTIYFKYKIKEMLTNAELLGWGIGFVEFWVIMWVFVFSGSAKVSSEWERYLASINASMAFAFLGLITIGSIGIALAYSILYSSRAARYLTKYTKLSPALLLTEDFLSSLIVLLIFIFIIYISVLTLSYFKWNVYPRIENPFGVIVDLILAGVLLYWLSYTLALGVIVLRRVRAISMVSYIPLILAFVAYAQLWIELKSLIYIIPLVQLPALIMYHATGAIPPTGCYLKWLVSSSLLTPVNLRLAAVSLFIWIAIFILASLLLIRRSRGIAIEEIGF